MARAGVRQEERMKITRHQTASVDRRFNIVDGTDIESVRERMDARLKRVK
jgi:hypothetical protein